jgi:oligo-1,6-glucosidase
MLFQFEHMDVDYDRTAGLAPRAWQLAELKAIITRWQKDIAAGGGWNSQYLSNHDQPRPVSRFGDDKQYRVESAKLLGTFLHLLQGTPYVYEGEEIGMTNVAFPSIKDYRDIETLNKYREAVGSGKVPAELAMTIVHQRSRDNARTPMQWNSGPNAGFTSGTPWLKVNPNYREINVEAALADPDSILRYYQRLIRLRREHPVVVYGEYDILLPEHPQVWAFTRTLGEERLLVILNWSGVAAEFALPVEVETTGQELLIANYPVGEGEDLRGLTLRPWEARVYRLR